MASSQPSQVHLRFGPFELDATAGRLLKSGIPIKLQPQPFRVLLLLVEHAGQVVTREEIQQCVWGDSTFVDFEHGINFSINQIRSALCDCAEKPSYIETIPRRGYRFIHTFASRADSNTASVTAAASEPLYAWPVDQEPPIVGETSAETVALPVTTISRKRGLFITALSITVIAAVIVIVVMMWPRLLLSRREPLPQLTQHQLTSNSTENTVWSGSIAPNGKYLAYVDGKSMRVKHMETGEVAAVPEPEDLRSGEVRWRIASWLPDSSGFLVVATQAPLRTSTWTVSLLGDAPKLLRNDAAAWSVSSDGDWIAFTADAARFGDHGSNGDHELWVMRSDGNDAHKIGETDETSTFSRVKWSADGNGLAYIRRQLQGQQSERSIEVRNIRGGPPRTLVSDPGLQDFLWLPNGRLLYVVSEPGSLAASCNFWEKPANVADNPGGKSRRITNWAGFCIDDLSVTAGGEVVVFRKWSVQSSAYVADLELHGKRIADPRRLTLNEDLNVPTAWSADSKAVIFYSRQNDRTGIFKQSLDKETSEPLVSGTENMQVPRLAPDGRSVLYLQIPRDAGPSPAVSIMRVPINGGPPKPVFTGPVLDTHRCASPPAKLCVIAERSADHRQIIFSALDPSTGRGRELARIEVRDRNAFYNWDISPDGTRIALLDVLHAHVSVLPLTAGKRRQDFTVEHYRDLRSFDWAPDGKGFFSSSVSTAGSILLHIDMHGLPRILWEVKGSTAVWGVPSPDGHRLVMSAFVVGGNMWTLEHF